MQQPAVTGCNLPYCIYSTGTSAQVRPHPKMKQALSAPLFPCSFPSSIIVLIRPHLFANYPADAVNQCEPRCSVDTVDSSIARMSRQSTQIYKAIEQSKDSSSGSPVLLSPSFSFFLSYHHLLFSVSQPWWLPSFILHFLLLSRHHFTLSLNLSFGHVVLAHPCTSIPFVDSRSACTGTSVWYPSWFWP